MEDPFEVKQSDRVAVLLFGYYCVVRVKRVWETKVRCGDEILTETIFETKSGLVFSTHPRGNLLSFDGRNNVEYEDAGARKTWVRRVLNKGERQTEKWAIGES